MDIGWDEGTRDHATRHGVTVAEIEQTLLDPNGVLGRAYSVEGEYHEARIGITRTGRLIFVVYTEREERVRPLHARPANRREEKEYYGR